MAKTPKNRNFLQVNGFEFVLSKTPNLEFFVQEVRLPGLTIPNVRIPNPLIDIKEQGDTGQYSELGVTFIADEDLRTWEELFTWFSSVTFPKNSKQRAKTRDELFADITVIVQTSHHNSNFQFQYIDAFPTSVSELELKVTNAGTEFLMFNVSFDFTNISFDRIKK